MDYLISNDTIAIKKEDNKITIINVENSLVININLKKFLNFNCLCYGSNLKGRLEYVKKLLNIKYKIPILISEKDDLILLPVKSLKSSSNLLIMGSKIINYEKKNNVIRIECVNKEVFEVNISKYCLEKMLINFLKLNNKIKWQSS